jgi:UDP-3-O-[3-hydroxymyristoyl] N-acetylglucosamine deacetylase
MLQLLNRIGEEKYRTIVGQVSFGGKGIHCGVETMITIKPSDEAGIRFVRTDILDKNPIVLASYENVKNTFYNTTIVNADGVSVSTIEHLMASLWHCGISSAVVEINGPEVPIMDGGCTDFIFGLMTCDTAGIDAMRPIFRVASEFSVSLENGAVIHASPLDGFQVEFVANFSSKAVGVQKFLFCEKDSCFLRKIATARTFSMLHDIEKLKAAGMASGGNYNNALVFNEIERLNSPCFVTDNDPVKHKILDFIGDIYLFQSRIQGLFKCNASGHKLNSILVSKLAQSL